jgi:hypothetical protein
MKARSARHLPPRAEVVYRRITYTKLGEKRWVSDDGARLTDALVDVMLGDGAVIVSIPAGPALSARAEQEPQP